MKPTDYKRTEYGIVSLDREAYAAAKSRRKSRQVDELRMRDIESRLNRIEQILKGMTNKEDE